MMAITRKQLLKELLPGLNKLFGVAYEKIITEYHARRTNHDPTLWKVVEVHRKGKGVVGEKELATDLKRNRAQALVRLLRSNQQHGS
jgi:hypothetical protein